MLNGRGILRGRRCREGVEGRWMDIKGRRDGKRKGDEMLK